MCRSVAAGTATACGCTLYRGCCAAAGTGADHPKGAHMNAVARLALRRAAHRAARERSYEETGRAARALARGQVAGCAARVTARQRNPRHGARGPCTHAEQALGSSSDCAQLRQPSAPDHSFKAGCRQAWRSQQTIRLTVPSAQPYSKHRQLLTGVSPYQRLSRLPQAHGLPSQPACGPTRARSPASRPASWLSARAGAPAQASASSTAAPNVAEARMLGCLRPVLRSCNLDRPFKSAGALGP